MYFIDGYKQDGTDMHTSHMCMEFLSPCCNEPVKYSHLKMSIIKWSGWPYALSEKNLEASKTII